MRLKYYRTVMALTLILLLKLQGCTSKNTKKNDGNIIQHRKNFYGKTFIWMGVLL